MNGNRLGGWFSRLMSTFVTGGASSEILTKIDRQNCCLPENIEAFLNFEPPELSHYQCFFRAFPKYDRSNVPFYQYCPTADEIEKNNQICQKMDEKKKKEQAEAKERRAARKRLENDLRNRQAAEGEVAAEGEAVADGEVPAEGYEELDQVFEENQDLINDLVEDLVGIDAGMDDIVFGVPTRSGRTPRPSAKLRNLYE